MVRRHLGFWVGQGVLKEHPTDTFTVVEEQQEEARGTTGGKKSLIGCCLKLPYSRKVLREKTFVHFTFCICESFLHEILGMAFFGAAKANNSRKFSLGKHHFMKVFSLKSFCYRVVYPTLPLFFLPSSSPSFPLSPSPSPPLPFSLLPSPPPFPSPPFPSLSSSPLQVMWRMKRNQLWPQLRNRKRVNCRYTTPPDVA